jgi:hypothetical protein
MFLSSQLLTTLQGPVRVVSKRKHRRVVGVCADRGRISCVEFIRQLISRFAVAAAPFHFSHSLNRKYRLLSVSSHRSRQLSVYACTQEDLSTNLPFSFAETAKLFLFFCLVSGMVFSSFKHARNFSCSLAFLCFSSAPCRLCVRLFGRHANQTRPFPFPPCRIGSIRDRIFLRLLLLPRCDLFQLPPFPCHFRLGRREEELGRSIRCQVEAEQTIQTEKEGRKECEQQFLPYIARHAQTKRQDHAKVPRFSRPQIFNLDGWRKMRKTIRRRREIQTLFVA